MSRTTGRSRRASSQARILLALFFYLTLGCTPKTSQYTYLLAQDQEQLGQVRLAVTSVSRWKDVQTDLQPKFDLSPAGALQEVAPTTQFTTEQLIQERMAKLGLGLPTSTTTETEATVFGSTASRQRTLSETQGPGQAPTVVGANPQRPLSVPTYGNQTPGIEPTLKYALATSLLQYVRLTNRYVEDYVRYEGYEAYVIRLHISLMPEIRNMPYDTYIDVGFFPSVPLRAWSEGGHPTAPLLLSPTAPAIPFGKSEQAFERPIVVLPLLSADSVEGLLQSRSVDEIRDLALSLAATMHNVGASVNLGNFVEQLKTVLGRDYNSVSTIGVRNDSIVRIRLGALQQATSQYGMVPRQQSISAVALVKAAALTALSAFNSPSPSPGYITAVGLARHVSAIDGSVPPNRDRKRLESEREEIIKRRLRIERKTELDTYDVRELSAAVQQNDFNVFRMVLGRMTRGSIVDIGTVGGLWLELSGLPSAGQPQEVVIALPGTRAFEPPPAQTALLADDGRKTTTLLKGGAFLQLAQVTAVLKANLTADVGGTPGQQQTIYAESAVTMTDGRDLQLVFPSFSAGKVKVSKADVLLSYRDLDGRPIRLPAPVPYPAMYVQVKGDGAAEPSKPGAIKAIADTVLVDANGEGTLKFTVSAPTDGKEYFVAGPIKSATPPEVLGSGPSGSLAILKDGDASITLKNLVAGASVSLVIQTKDGKQVDKKDLKVVKAP